MTWTAPTDGGSPITSYTLSELSGPTVLNSWDLPASATSHVVTGLTGGAAYSFTIVANNAFGPSPVATTNTITAAAAPGPVSAVTATAGNTVATVSWTGPGQRRRLGGHHLHGHPDRTRRPATPGHRHRTQPQRRPSPA